MIKLAKFVLIAIALVGVYEEYLSVKVMMGLELLSAEFFMIGVIAISILFVIVVLIYNIVQLEWYEK